MSSRALWKIAGALLGLAASGCPMTDDYFIEEQQPMGSGGGASAGTEPGPNNRAGVAGLSMGGSVLAAGGQPSGGAGSPACAPSTERCNGHDDDCDGVVDEDACDTGDCAGFVLSPGSVHGYMFCSDAKSYAQAQAECQGNGLRLLWLESARENREVADKLGALGAPAEVWLGASDAEVEGSWSWQGPGGVLFWRGNEKGHAVDGFFEAWADSAPNNGQQGGEQGEDCAVLTSGGAHTWGDRSCHAEYAYVCEEPE